MKALSKQRITFLTRLQIFSTKRIDSPEGKIKFEIICEQYKNLMFYVANKILGNTRDSEGIVYDEHIEVGPLSCFQRAA